MEKCSKEEYQQLLFKYFINKNFQCFKYCQSIIDPEENFKRVLGHLFFYAAPSLRQYENLCRGS